MSAGRKVRRAELYRHIESETNPTYLDDRSVQGVTKPARFGGEHHTASGNRGQVVGTDSVLKLYDICASS